MILMIIGLKFAVDLETKLWSSYGRTFKNPLISNGSIPTIFENVALDNKLITRIRLATISGYGPICFTDLLRSSISKVGIEDDHMMS